MELPNLDNAPPGDEDSIRRERLCSHNSRQPAFTAFVNKTRKDITLEWLDFDGNHVTYKERLRPREVMRMNTYVGHPWIFYEADSRHPLRILPDRKRIYMPHGYEGGLPPYRPVFIVSPCSSLQQLCLKFLHIHLIKSCARSAEVYDQNLEKLKDEMGILHHHWEQLRRLENHRSDKNIPLYIPTED